MSRTVLSALELPKAAVLTRALVDPVVPPVDPVAVEGIRARLTDAVGRRSLPAGRRLRVDAFTLRTAPLPANDRDPGPAFEWSPRTACRRIGLAAVRACVRGAEATPTDAVGSVVDDLIRLGVAGAARRGSLAEWLGSAGPGLVGITRAEAVTWATRLLTTLEWTRLGPGSSVGGADEWWDHPGAPAVCLRGRCDVRVVGRSTGAGGPTGPPPFSLVTMLGGRPGPTARAELGLAALVGALGQSGRGRPARVAGYWPDCGRALVLPVDVALLEHTATSVIGALGAPGVNGPAGHPAVPMAEPPGADDGDGEAGLAA